MKTLALPSPFLFGPLVVAQDTGAPAAIYMTDAEVEAELQAAAAGSAAAGRCR